MKNKEKEYFIEFSNRNDIFEHHENIDIYTLRVKQNNVYSAICDASIALSLKLGDKVEPFILTCVAECNEKSNFPMKDFYRMN